MLNKGMGPEYSWINGHRMHVFRAGNENKPKLIFMAGSGTAAPVYDFKVLYEKLISDFRVIVIEKFGYGYSDLYEGSCDIDSVVSFQRQALEQAGEKGPYILMPHSMSGLEAIRWKQKYPDEISAVIGLDMATPGTYLSWDDRELEKRIRTMEVMRRLNEHGLFFWYPLSKRCLNKDEIREQKILFRRNAMNKCMITAAEAVKQNAEAVASAGTIEGPVLMFVSDEKQVSPGWIDHERDFARKVNAEMIYLNCGHYIHYYESDKIAAEIKRYLCQILQ